jgi:tetratricopeptide (TPR) repeat protein
MNQLFKALTAAVVAAALAAGVSARQLGEPGEPPSGSGTEAALQVVQDLFVRALDEYNGDQQSRSIPIFDEVISELQALHGREGAPAAVEEILVQAHDLKGRAYFNLGSEDEARESFRSLIRIRPGHSLPEDQVSPKVLSLFENVKESLVGYLAVSSQPAGAQVSINAKPFALTDFFPMEVLAGPYLVEVSRDGYAPETRSVTIAPGATETLEVELTRVAASLLFVTEPSDVEIWVDGELRGRTAGTLPPDLAEGARLAGLEPSRASAVTEVANLPPGTHQVEYRKRCYTPALVVVETPEAMDYHADPIRLEPSLGTLSLTSDPPGAQIFIDDEFKGFTPKELDSICSGRFRLEVKHSSGKFLQDVELGKNETLTLDCPIRPSLAFLGVVAEGPSGERVREEVAEAVIENFSRVSSLNFLPTAADTVERLLGAEGLTLARMIPGGETAPDVIKRVGERVGTALDVQGFLIAYLPEEELQRSAVLHLLAAGNAESDTGGVLYAESPSYLSFLAKLDRRATVYRPWTGLITVDTLIHEGVPVLRVVPDGPAARAGVVVDEVLTAVDGQVVGSTADLLALQAAKQPGDTLSLQLDSGAGARTVQLALAEAPEEVPLHDPDLLYNKIMMDLRQQVEGYPGTPQAAYARLNWAIAAMHFEDFAQAHEHLLKAQGELRPGPGISQGTALYYLGVVLERLGYQDEATDAYRQAADHDEATLFNNDGPRVAPLAARRAGGV